ncbi:MAG: hypothetical protein JWM91_1880 [Rhodospirillales bacterium]|nr:hypothetical protein [Rhodospirillales bacterium]
MKLVTSGRTAPLTRIILGVAATLMMLAFAANPTLAQKRGGGGPTRSRLLLVFAPDESNKSLTDQYSRLQRDSGAIDSEDVDVIYVIGDHMVKLPPPDMKTVSGDEMRKHYHVDATGFRVVLVGGDGWEKARWSEPTDAKKILSRAADMPKPKSALDDEKH